MDRRSFVTSVVSIAWLGLAASMQAQDSHKSATCRLCNSGYELVRGSFAYEQFRCASSHVHHVAKQYVPKEGDLVFFNSGGPVKQALWAATFSGGGYSEPTHVGIIVKDAYGTPSLLQALDPDFKGNVARRQGIEPGRVCLTSDVVSYLRDYPGMVWVRQYRRELCSKHSAALTNWAARQVGKRYAVEKLLHPSVLVLPVQTTHLFGPARTESDSWHCSGLVAAALVTMGHYDRWDLRPSATDPEDLFSDRILDLSPAWKPPIRWGASAHQAKKSMASDSQAHSSQQACSSEQRHVAAQNDTAIDYDISVGGKQIGRIAPGQHVQATAPKGNVRLDAIPASGGRAYTEEVGSFSDVVWAPRKRTVDESRDITARTNK